MLCLLCVLLRVSVWIGVWLVSVSGFCMWCTGPGGTCPSLPYPSFSFLFLLVWFFFSFQSCCLLSIVCCRCRMSMYGGPPPRWCLHLPIPVLGFWLLFPMRPPSHCPSPMPPAPRSLGRVSGIGSARGSRQAASAPVVVCKPQLSIGCYCVQLAPPDAQLRRNAPGLGGEALRSWHAAPFAVSVGRRPV